MCTRRQGTKLDSSYCLNIFSLNQILTYTPPRCRSVPVSPLSLMVFCILVMPKQSISILVMPRYTLTHTYTQLHTWTTLYNKKFLSDFVSMWRLIMASVSCGMMTQTQRKRRRSTLLPSKTWWSGLVSIKIWLGWSKRIFFFWKLSTLSHLWCLLFSFKTFKWLLCHSSYLKRESWHTLLQCACNALWIAFKHISEHDLN